MSHYVSLTEWLDSENLFQGSETFQRTRSSNGTCLIAFASLKQLCTAVHKKLEIVKRNLVVAESLRAVRETDT